MFNSLMNPSQDVLIGLMFLAAFRIYLEIIGFRIAELPISKLMAKNTSLESVERFHRMGLFFAIGHILLFAPELLLN
jgi:hypothetical protein